jgi:hypothetical protein
LSTVSILSYTITVSGVYFTPEQDAHKLVNYVTSSRDKTILSPVLYVFEVKESIFDIFTELTCLLDLENPGQLPVSQVLEGTDDWVLWIFVISSFPTFSRSRNPFFAVSQSYHVRKTSKIEVNFRFHRCSRD